MKLSTGEPGRRLVVRESQHSYSIGPNTDNTQQLNLHIEVVERMYKVKIVMVGPCQSGKTMIANFLADATETVGGEYRPTAGVRILEFELGSVNVNNKNIKVGIRNGRCFEKPT